MVVIKILNSSKATIIPCIHKESGCSGLFNKITNEFYPIKITELEYIQSAETQYVDTGVQPKGGRLWNRAVSTEDIDKGEVIVCKEDA